MATAGEAWQRLEREEPGVYSDPELRGVWRDLLAAGLLENVAPRWGAGLSKLAEVLFYEVDEEQERRVAEAKEQAAMVGEY